MSNDIITVEVSSAGESNPALESEIADTVQEQLIEAIEQPINEVDNEEDKTSWQNEIQMILNQNQETMTHLMATLTAQSGALMGLQTALTDQTAAMTESLNNITTLIMQQPQQIPQSQSTPQSESILKPESLAAEAAAVVDNALKVEEPDVAKARKKWI